ncbi:MAG TPA: IPT/TIG domain-containing protein [Labilithrix sp.]|nr:IPT/TIG domain-containing protein [Labilithrix sp.]
MKGSVLTAVWFIGLGVVACSSGDRQDNRHSSSNTAAASEDDRPPSGSAALAHYCEGYKPHIDGHVWSGDYPSCPTCVGIQRGRLATTQEPQSCTDVRPPPAIADASTEFHYTAYRYQNRKTTSSCIEIIVTQYTGRAAGTGLRAAAYRAPFDPSDVQKNYLGDGAVADVPEHRFSFAVGPLEQFDVVLTGAAEGSAAADSGASFRLDVLGCGRVALSDITPATGPTAGGTKVTLRGAGFRTATPNVRIGWNVSSATVIDDNTLTAITLPAPAGTYDVTVFLESEGLPTTTLPNAFTYLDDAGTEQDAGTGELDAGTGGEPDAGLDDGGGSSDPDAGGGKTW